MFLSELINECNESIRVHHASGHFTREKATVGLVANGLTADEAAALLDQQVDPALFDEYKTYPRENA